MSIPAGTLEVHLEFASGLSIGSFRIGSPYAVISCGHNQQVKSRTAEGQGSRPVFNETYTFRVDETTPELSIWMYNKRTFQNDDELGWIRIPFANLFHGEAGIIKLPSSSYAITSQTSGQREGELRLSVAFTPRSQGSAHGYGGHAHPNPVGGSQGPSPSRGHSHSMYATAPTSNRGPYIPSFRSNQGRRTEAELRDIAANALNINALDWIKLCAKMEFEDCNRLEDHLISPEVMKQLEARTAQVPPAALQQILLQFDASDMVRLQALSAHAEAKKAAELESQRPARAPKSSSGPYVPSFRSNQGRRPEAELREIASNAFNIHPLDMAKLFAKMEFEDVQQLTSNLLSPEDVAELGAMQSRIPPQESEQLLKQLDPSDMQRLEVIQSFAAKNKMAMETEQRRHAQTMLQQQRTINAMQRATRMGDAATRAAAESGDRMDCIGTGYHMVRTGRLDDSWDMNDI